MPAAEPDRRMWMDLPSQAAALMDDLVLNDEFATFLTLKAYEAIAP